MTEKNEKPAKGEALATAADAAAFIERKADDYANRFGYGVAGQLSFASQVKMDHYTSLTELAVEIRLLAAPSASAQQAEPVAWSANWIRDRIADQVEGWPNRDWSNRIIANQIRRIEIAAPAPSASPVPTGDDQKDLYNLCAALVDICDDATNNPPESRAYVDGAYTETVAELRELLLPAPSASPAALTVPAAITDWHAAWQAHNDAVTAYNARVAFARANEGKNIGSIHCDVEFRMMTDAKNAMFRMLPALFEGITALLAASPADQVEDARLTDADAITVWERRSNRLETPGWIADFARDVQDFMADRRRWRAMSASKEGN